MRRTAAFVVTGAVVTAAAALVLVAVRGPEPARSLEERVQEVASTLRCPVCRDLSVADSPSLVARQMRDTIARRLRAGQSDEEIRDFFVSRYGESILLTPSAGGIDVLAWILPGLLFAAGVAVVMVAVRRWSRPPPIEADLTEDDRRLVERELGRVDG